MIPLRQSKFTLFSELDVLVNSAGILMSGSTLNLSLEDYDKVGIMNSKLR